MHHHHLKQTNRQLLQGTCGLSDNKPPKATHCQQVIVTRTRTRTRSFSSAAILSLFFVFSCTFARLHVAVVPTLLAVCLREFKPGATLQEEVLLLTLFSKISCRV